MARPMTAADLYDLLLSALTRTVGGSRRRWRIVIGDIRVYGLDTHPHCNWSVSPSGSVAEIAAVENAVDDLRGRHPIVTPE